MQELNVVMLYAVIFVPSQFLVYSLSYCLLWCFSDIWQETNACLCTMIYICYVLNQMVKFYYHFCMVNFRQQKH